MKPIPRLTARSLLGCVFGAAFSFIPAAAAAQNPRPPQLIQEGFIGDLAFTQPRGEIQISSLLRAAGPSANRTASVPLQIEYGITDDIQVNIETGGFNYVRPTGWSSPGEFHLGLRYGRYGLLPNLHASVTIEAESQGEGGKRLTNTMSGLQLGVDIARLRMTHVFTSVVGGVWSSAGTRTAVDWVAGAVVPFGQLRATFERPLRVSDPANRGAVPGLVWKAGGPLEIGIATTLRTQPAMKLSGVMLSFLVEF